ncbi:NAD(P)/FAD-dependent oxidoreductase [Amycolatopsis acidiphila]|uniref:Pyridine nucleotide-disulfide oxidoreductase domain-containing protein 2 n=1 Tax=Amycolatopsis acidiphila TaxID=715473 RepID=A0A558A6Z1_9PSEU|nr:NAD(P)/FAD-dependent oxidoreductase [Amycolatopsis acidiphila]TVT20039.1 NAD(P)/FAD-dependent oxidoreductase [Amycolatopsis acidiphila]UIJ63503.1 NAD(P)/FAD-dependent oxidoreductase [Amycolatopsis acidiphila]GHG68554.1 FAD-dependent oxidoreductase [Amycolatopsis acidiphila]
MEHAAETVDAVVVGAGHNGLVAANILADAGWDVLVLEAAETPGGAVRTAELTAPGFRNDVCSAFYPLGAASPVLSALGLHEYGLRWRHAPAPLAHVLPDDRAAVISRDLDRTMASVARFSPADADAWRAEFEAWTQMREQLLDALFQPFPPVRAAARLGRRLGVADSLRFARLVTMPVRALAEERFSGEGAQLLLAGNAQHTDLGPGDAGSAIFGWLLAMLAQDVGYPVPEGGAGRLAIALANRLTAAGGRVACQRPVTRIHTAGGEAVAVSDASGRLVRARRAVLATVPAPTLYRELLDPDVLPPRLLADLRGFHWDDPTVKVDWALSRPIPWRNPEVGQAGTVHLDADMTGLADYHHALSVGRLPEKPFLLLGQMTTADETRSPAGTESAWAYTHVPREHKWDRDSLRQFADRLEAVVERHAPGFTGHIEARAIHGPDDLFHVDGNLVGGAINAGTAAIHQQLFFRPVPGLARADTPVDRLFLAGASAHPGGAVHGGPGANAARAALRRASRGGTTYRRVIQRLNAAVYR